MPGVHARPVILDSLLVLVILNAQRVASAEPCWTAQSERDLNGSANGTKAGIAAAVR
jgi:hypothetical protein